MADLFWLTDEQWAVMGIDDLLHYAVTAPRCHLPASYRTLCSAPHATLPKKRIHPLLPYGRGRRSTPQG